MNINPNFFFSITIIGTIVLVVYFYQKNHLKGKSKKDAHAQFTFDLTQKAEEDKIDPISGRDDETDRVIHILMRRTKNNPLLIGQPGVGKTAMVEGLALRIAKGTAPKALLNKRVLVLDLAMLVSETKFRGELEGRLKNLIEQLESLDGKAILFIDEIHMLEQIGKSEGSLNISDVFKPALARGKLRVIGATTWHEYEKYIQPDQALDRRFQPVLVDEPTQEDTLNILKNLRPTYEEFHNVKITDEALQKAVEWSDQKIKHRFLPDKAIDLIDEASAKVAIEASSAHIIPIGALHAASKNKSKKTRQSTVDVKDVQNVFDQWVIHSTEDKKRDARK